MGDLILPDGSVFRFDDAQGVWRHVPDVDTANAMGVDFDNLSAADTLPGDQGADWPSVDQAAPEAAPTPPATPPPPLPAAPADSFLWGGQTWRQGELAAFIGYLVAHGASYSTWAASHPDAAALLEGPPTDAQREPLPKPLGEALGAYIQGGATPAQAAAQTEALRSSLVAQGVSSVTAAQLVADAQQVAAAYIVNGGTVTAAPVDISGIVAAEVTRQLQSGRPGQVAAVAIEQAFQPQGAAEKWKALVNFFKLTVPKRHADAKALADKIEGVFS